MRNQSLLLLWAVGAALAVVGLALLFTGSDGTATALFVSGGVLCAASAAVAYVQDRRR